MATTNKDLAQPTVNSTNWDVPINANTGVIDAALGGNTTKNVTGVDATPVVLTASEYQKLILTFTGTLTANVTYQIPAGVGGQWIVRNATSGSFTVTIGSVGGGTSGVTPQGTQRTVYSDGTNIRFADDQTSSPAFTGTPTAPTAAVGTNTTQLATTAFVNAEIANDAPTKTGGGASGTWAIAISGNAATASNPSGGGTFITSSNIGSQSVNYATSAGNASTVTTVTSGQVATANAALGEGGVGTWGFFYNSATSIYNFGSTVSGSSLYPAGIAASSVGNVSYNVQGTLQSGTWRCMGYSYYLLDTDNSSRTRYGYTVWLRIS
jgi:hypothetical protein